MALNALSDWSEDLVTKILTGQAAGVTLPLTPYLALFTTLPNEDGTGGVEVSTTSTGYSRKALAGKLAAPARDATSGNMYSLSNADVSFGTATATWGTVVGVAIMTAATGGNIIVLSSLSNKTVNSGDTVNFASGNIRVEAS